MRHSPVVSLPYGPAIFYGSLLLIWTLEQVRTSRSAPEGEVERDRGTRHLIRRVGLIAYVLGIAAAYAIPKATIPVRPNVALFSGLAVQWIGFALVLWTTRILGELYRPVVAVQIDHRVVRSGPYRLIRHPMYAGGLLTDIGTGLMLANAVSLVLLLGLGVFAYAKRIVAEEQLLLDTLGDEYRDYARSTKRLIPFVW